MSLAQSLFSPLAEQVKSTWTFTYDEAAKVWNVEGQVKLDIPEDSIAIDETVKWQFSNRLVASHEPKLKLREALEGWGLKDSPKFEAIFQLLDYHFRNDRQCVIDQIYGVYEPR